MIDQMKQQIKRSLESGELYPYDGEGVSKDWTHLAARGILADLQDRKGIKHEFYLVDDDIRKEIVQTISDIIKEAYKTINKQRRIYAMKIEDIAKICHEANKAYCETLGDTSQSEWAIAPEWQKKSAINGVKFHLENPDAKASHSHEEWLKEKRDAGWKYGPVKDSEKKEHPCFVTFDELPEEQQAKDYLFKGIVKSLSKFLS